MIDGWIPSWTGLPDGSQEGEALAEQQWNAELDEAARRGISGAGERLPHRDAIQTAFGRHDVTGVRAHLGGPAADAARAIGAEAFATGDDVAFASPPSLFVAAHEAAHVVQQRQGVSLLGGVGREGDVYEEHADAVAARVVRGESAEALLDAAPGGGSPRAAIQRKATPDPTDAHTPVADVSFGWDHRFQKLDERLTVSGTLKFSWNDPHHLYDTPAGRAKFMQPEVKLRAHGTEIQKRFGAKLLELAIGANLGYGLKVEFLTQGVDLDVGLDDGVALTVASVGLRISGDLTQFLEEIGLDLEPYKVSLQLTGRIRLDPSEVRRAFDAIRQLKKLERLEKDLESARRIARDLDATVVAAKRELEAARRSKHLMRIKTGRRCPM
jgi:hypothetical protein